MSAPLRRRRRLAWVAYLAVGALACALYLAVPPLKGSGPLMNLIGLSPVIAILVGVRWHRPAARGAWYLLAAGSALFWLGDLYTYSYPHLLGADVPFPSPGDALYVAMYPVMMAGLLLLVRSRNAGSDRSGLVDGLILTVGLSLPSWIGLMAPYLHLDDLSTLGKIVSVAYPVGDVILIGAVVRLALDGGRREPAFHLLTGSILLLLITDFGYGLLTLHGMYEHQLSLDAGWIGSYLLWGAAALHPSMAGLEQPALGREVVLTRFRLALLTCAWGTSTTARSASPRSCSSASSWCGWPVSCASRSVRSTASACSAAPGPISSRRPTAPRSSAWPWTPPARSPRPAPRWRCAGATRRARCGSPPRDRSGAPAACSRPAASPPRPASAWRTCACQPARRSRPAFRPRTTACW